MRPPGASVRRRADRRPWPPTSISTSTSRTTAVTSSASVVDDPVRADGPQMVELVVARRGRDRPRAEGLGDLDRERPDPAAGAGDEDVLAGLEGRLVAQPLERGQRGHRDRRRLLERQVRGLAHEVPARDVVAERAVPAAVHLVAHPKIGHRGPDGLDDPRRIDAHLRRLRSTEALTEAGHVGLAAEHVPVEGVDRRGMDAHEDLVVLGRRHVGLLEGQDLGAAVAMAEDGAHGVVLRTL